MMGNYQPLVDLTLPQMLGMREDRFSEFRGLGISSMAFKVTSRESSNLFVVELTVHKKGGPALHLHQSQDEWFYFLGGEFVVEIGEQCLFPHTGDSLLVPKNTPHTWAFIGEGRGRFITAFSPAGNIEDFLRAASDGNAMPEPDSMLWQRYGIEVLGPPLLVE